MPNYYEEQVKNYGRKKRVDKTEVRVISTTESYQIRSSWNKSIPHSEATKEKIRLSCSKSGVGTWNKDIKIKQQRQSQKVKEVMIDRPLSIYAINGVHSYSF